MKMISHQKENYRFARFTNELNCWGKGPSEAKQGMSRLQISFMFYFYFLVMDIVPNFIENARMWIVWEQTLIFNAHLSLIADLDEEMMP